MSLPALADLPALAFGAHQATAGYSIKELSESTRRVVPGLISYDAPKTEDFCYRTAFTRINGLALSAISVPATHLGVGSQPQGTMIFAAAGEFSFSAQGGIFLGSAGSSAVFIPSDCPTVMQASKRSSVVIQIDQNRLKHTSATMLGAGLRESEILLNPAPRQMALTHGKLSLDAIYRSLFTQIDLYADSPDMLQLSGIDEVFYRHLAIALNPDAFIREAENRRLPLDRRRLARVCEYVAANLGGPISLTDLERVGHMSRKTLYNAFVKATAMSPAAWVREQRLQKARGLLTTTVLSVTEVLLACGFTHPSQFAAIYARRFGELPSATSKRKQD